VTYLAVKIDALGTATVQKLIEAFVVHLLFHHLVQLAQNRVIF
jgi:hypothetical protein